MDAEDAEESQKQPGNIIIKGSGLVLHISFTFHGWNFEDINEPTNQEETESAEVNRSGDGSAVIEAMRTSEAKNP